MTRDQKNILIANIDDVLYRLRDGVHPRVNLIKSDLRVGPPNSQFSEITSDILYCADEGVRDALYHLGRLRQYVVEAVVDEG